MYRSFFKRAIDVLVSGTAIIILYPLFLVIMMLLFVANNGKPFFYQLRPGKDAKLFNAIKFKTMNDKTGPDGELLHASERITPLGNFLRKTSLDELPQLINVIKGEMSLVGPRPLLPKYVPLYNEFQYRRHEVRPGITGWAQVNGRNAISWERKFELDVYYVDHLSFGFDLKILWLTLIKVFRAEGISPENQTIMEPFTGTKSQQVKTL